VAGERALLFSPQGGPRSLVVGDLHFGIESEYAFAGVKLPSAGPAMARRLAALAGATGARKLVIAGDLKHSVQTVTRQEEEEVPAALAELAGAFAEVVVVPGNHDGNAARLLPEGTPSVRMAPVGGELLRGGLLVIHGHAWPDPALAGKARGIALAHNHTAVALEDGLGRIAKEPCWVRGRVNPERWGEATGADSYPEVIMMPPFNELCAGVALNLAGVRPIGPLLREGCVDLPRAEVFLLDGAMLGTVGSLILHHEGDALRRATRGASEDQ
jgi:putative SbcD/Mre11-related phosphoesterase